MSNGRPTCGEQTGQVVAGPTTNILAHHRHHNAHCRRHHRRGETCGWSRRHFHACPYACRSAWAESRGHWSCLRSSATCSSIAAGPATAASDAGPAWSTRHHRCFDSGWDVIFPSEEQMHPRVDIVVKSRFWPLTTQGAGYVACSLAPPGIGSPMIQTFYKSDAVCAAGVGALIGAGVGVATTVAIAVAIGAIGCATIIFCLLALLLAAIIGAVIALVGAAAGGAIGRAAAGDQLPDGKRRCRDRRRPTRHGQRQTPHHGGI